MKKMHTAAFAAALSLLTVPAFADYNRPVAETKITALQALATAEKQAGGRPTEVDLENKHTQPVYKVELRNGDQEHKVHIDALSGQIISSRMEVKQRPAVAATVSLARAIEIAQRQVSGRVMQAEYEHVRGQQLVKVEILNRENVPYKVFIDAQSGKVLSSHVDYDD